MEYLKVWGKDKVLVPQELKLAFKQYDVCSFFHLLMSVLVLTIYYPWLSQEQVLALTEGPCEGSSLFDPFHLVLIHKAFDAAPWMKYAIFGLDSYICQDLPGGPLKHNDPIAGLFKGYSKFQSMNYLAKC